MSISSPNVDIARIEEYVRGYALLFLEFADVEFLGPTVHPPVDSPDIVAWHVLAVPHDLDSLPLQHSPPAARVHA